MAGPQEYDLGLIQPFDRPGKLVRVTVHPPRCDINNARVFKAIGQNYLPLAIGNLQGQLQNEGYPPVRMEGPVSVSGASQPLPCECDGGASPR